MEQRPKPSAQGAEEGSSIRGGWEVAPTSATGKLPPPIEGVQGDYVVGPELARGGMGRILEAYDRRRDRYVALKLLLADSDMAARRFEREAWITGRLQHPAIVPVYEAGRLPSGERFYAMKLVRGQSLRDVLKTKNTLEERLALLPNLIALAEALAYAHEQGIIHRDLKSSNVLIGPFGETVVIDWGIAKLVAEAEPTTTGDGPSVPAGGHTGTTLTQEGAIVGTPQFMPPEQARGKPVDARADVYSLGACMYHALSGVPPYDARDSVQAIALLLTGPPKPLAGSRRGSRRTWRRSSRRRWRGRRRTGIRRRRGWRRT